jgi:hypothetical protein
MRVGIPGSGLMGGKEILVAYGVAIWGRDVKTAQNKASEWLR